MVTAPESSPSTLERLNKAEKIMRQQEQELGSWTWHHTFFSRCLLRGREATANNTGLCSHVKGRFWCELLLTGSFIVLFSREARTDEVSAMSSPSGDVCGPTGLGAAGCWRG